MARGRKDRRRNKGWFKKGRDPRRRVGFTQEQAKRGYLAALDAVAHDVHKHAWLFRRVRGFYRAKRRADNGQEEENGSRHFGPVGDGGDERDDGDGLPAG